MFFKTMLWQLATTSSLHTTTAPKGPPSPHSTPLYASSTAFIKNLWSLSCTTGLEHVLRLYTQSNSSCKVDKLKITMSPSVRTRSLSQSPRVPPNTLSEKPLFNSTERRYGIQQQIDDQLPLTALTQLLSQIIIITSPQIPGQCQCVMRVNLSISNPHS